MRETLPVVVLVGRPNVGKSTLFNRLTGTRDALVADRPGVTRDRMYGYAKHAGRRFLVVDTGGLGQDDEAIDALAARQTDLALAEADAVICLVDAADGLVPGDEAVAQRLRGIDKPVFTLVNKSEGRPAYESTPEFHALGLGEPRAVSAQRGSGLPAVMDGLIAAFPTADADTDSRPGEVLRIAVLGRPNAGKSTLVNRLLGEERMVTLDAPGTTRDAVASEVERDGRRYEIVDTAGVRRRSRIRDPLEKFSVVKALQAAEAADVVVVLVDARAGIGAQDARLLGLVVERGRAMVIGVNKWDGLDPDDRARVEDEIDMKLPYLDYVPIVPISALHGSGLGELLDAVQEVGEAARADLSTADLNAVLERSVARHAPPAVQGRRIKLRYAHQGGRNPPRIVIHGNQTERLPAEYRRYLVRCFREAFELRGVPVELAFRTGENPYAERGRRRR